MWLLNLSLRRPITIFVAMLGLALMAYFSFRRMPVDIFPNLDLTMITGRSRFGKMSTGMRRNEKYAIRARPSIATKIVIGRRSDRFSSHMRDPSLRCADQP